ncbi:hypothetical protein [Campylobacter jejuni]|uniref:hypothetical protein n=1 Tax=Campylobacter jejuni TaxID=197 RepID=UPI000F7FF295|nr:hypothetical protein [Campylobacter jejuni]RTJ28599.1 hypothetical protein C3H84_00270 [Campylobacter jejuni]
MHKKISEVANTEYNKEAITGMIVDFHKFCLKKEISIPQDYREECIERITIFYDKYLGTHKQKLVNFDYYKIISWYAVFIAEKMFKSYQEKQIKNINWFRVIVLAVWRMLEELERTEKRIIDKSYRDKIIAMVACELTNQKDFGIGKNGLYMLMLIARIVELSTPQTPH